MKDTSAANKPSLYDRIYDVVRTIPSGRVATYGQIAKILGRCGARQVGYAMAAVPEGLDVPWHRVINREGRVSARRNGGPGEIIQRRLLEDEGVIFDEANRVNLKKYLWTGSGEEE